MKTALAHGLAYLERTEVDRLQERFERWKAREECQEGCRLHLMQIFVFTTRREVHLRLVETFQVDTLPPPSPPTGPEKMDKREKGKEKKEKPSVLGGLRTLTGRTGNGGGGGKAKTVERSIDLVLQMPASGNTENVFFLERVEPDRYIRALYKYILDETNCSLSTYPRQSGRRARIE